MNSRISRKDKGTTLIKMVQMVSETPIFKEALKLFLKKSCLYNATCSCVQLVWSTPLVFVLGIKIWLQVFCRKCNHRRHCLRKDLLYLSRLDHVKPCKDSWPAWKAQKGEGRGGGKEREREKGEESYPLSPIPLPFSLPPNPLPFSTPAAQSKDSTLNCHSMSLSI